MQWWRRMSSGVLVRVHTQHRAARGVSERVLQHRWAADVYSICTTPAGGNGWARGKGGGGWPCADAGSHTGAHRPCSAVRHTQRLRTQHTYYAHTKYELLNRKICGTLLILVFEQGHLSVTFANRPGMVHGSVSCA